MDVWFAPYDELRGPNIIDFRGDPFEQAPMEDTEHKAWMLDGLFVAYPIQAYIGQFKATFEEYPSRLVGSEGTPA